MGLASGLGKNGSGANLQVYGLRGNTPDLCGEWVKGQASPRSYGRARRVFSNFVEASSAPVIILAPAMADPKAILGAVFGHLRAHPEELLRALKNLIALRLGVPLAALRWMASQPRRKGPQEIEIEAVPPGIRVAANIDLMGTPVRAGATVFVERVTASDVEFLVEVRVADVKMKLLDDTIESPVAALLRSGALDLSKPGNLVAYMPKRPALLVEAKGDRVVVDLFKLPKVAKSARARKVLSLLQPLITVGAIRTDPAGHLDVEFRPFPEGIGNVVQLLRSRF